MALTLLWPALLDPQATTEPSFFKATVQLPPAAIAVTPLCATAGTVSWSKLPHETTEPSFFKATVCPNPAAIAITPLKT
jgi:hypothetical protein